jgi:hypothetical protein
MAKPCFLFLYSATLGPAVSVDALDGLVGRHAREREVDVADLRLRRRVSWLPPFQGAKPPPFSAAQKKKL